MSPGYRLAGVHTGLLVLSVPLIMLWYVDGVGRADASGKWAYLGVATVYVIVAATGKPKALYQASGRLGVAKKVVRILLGLAALLTGSVAVGDAGGIGTALGVAAIVSALALFLWAVAIALFGGTPDSETV